MVPAQAALVDSQGDDGVVPISNEEIESHIAQCVQNASLSGSRGAVDNLAVEAHEQHEEAETDHEVAKSDGKLLAITCASMLYSLELKLQLQFMACNLARP